MTSSTGIRKTGPSIPTRLLAWLDRLAPPPASPQATWTARDRVQRGRRATVILLAVGALCVLTLPLAIFDGITIAANAAVPLLCAVGLWLNRRGALALAGTVMVAACDVALAGMIFATPNNKLALTGLFAITLMIAASVLRPALVPVVGLAHCAFFVADVFLQPNDPEYARAPRHHDFSMLQAAIATQLVLALIAFLWVRMTEDEMRRADHAEELVALRERDALRGRQEMERTRELELGVQQLLAVHVELANGNFATRVAPVRDPLLWKVGHSTNVLVGRMARLAEAERELRQVREQTHALMRYLSAPADSQAQLPGCAGTALDQVIALLGSTPRTPATRNYPASGPSILGNPRPATRPGVVASDNPWNDPVRDAARSDQSAASLPAPLA